MSYSEEEVCQIVEEVLFQVSMLVSDEVQDVEDDMRHKSDFVRAGMKKKKDGLTDAQEILETYASPDYFTKCCDSGQIRTGVHSFGKGWETKCTECGEKNPELYKVKPSLEELRRGKNND